MSSNIPFQERCQGNAGFNDPTLTASAAMVTDPSGNFASSVTTAAELAFVHGVTSSIQTQLNATLSTALASGEIFVGSAVGVATAVVMSGDVAIVASGATTIQPGAVTLAKQANLAANSIQGNNTGSAATPLALTVAQVNTMLGDILANGTVPFSAAQSMGGFNLTNVADPTTAQMAATKHYVDNAITGVSALPTNEIFVGSAGGVATAVVMSGDVAIVASGATTIQPNAVTNAKLATMAAHTVKANVTGGAAVPTDVSIVSAATASAAMIRDANANVQVNAVIPNIATTATAAGTTTLVVGSAFTQQFTGATTQTVVLPDATTMTDGQQFLITNRSTGVVTINKNGGGLLQTMAAGSQALVTLVTNGVAAGTWDSAYSTTAGGGGGGMTPIITKYGAGSFTFTPSGSTSYLEAILSGAGGGAPSDANASTAGGNTLLGSLVQANGGAGYAAATQTIGAQAALTVNAGATTIIGMVGSQGNAGSNVNGSQPGASNFLGGAGPAGPPGQGSVIGNSGGAGVPNSGAGGGAGGVDAPNGNSSSGDSGAFWWGMVFGPLAGSYSITVGGGGTGGAGSSSFGFNGSGGNGADGVVTIIEH